MGDLGFCHYSDIAGALARQLLSDLSSDQGVPLFIVRALHNKIITYLILSLRCYLGYFDSEMIFRFISPFLLPFLLSLLMPGKYRRILLLLPIFMPLFFIFNPLNLDLGSRISAYTWFFMAVAVVGCVKFISSLKARR